MYSVKPLSILRERLGITWPFSTSNSKRISSPCWKVIKIGSVKALSELIVNRAQNLVLIETRADGLANLGQEFIFLSTALRVVHDHVIFQGQANLQCQAY